MNRFQELLNEIQDYRQDKDERVRNVIRAKIESAWRQGVLSRMQMDVLTDIVEERR